RRLGGALRSTGGRRGDEGERSREGSGQVRRHARRAGIRQGTGGERDVEHAAARAGADAEQPPRMGPPREPEAPAAAPEHTEQAPERERGGERRWLRRPRDERRCSEERAERNQESVGQDALGERERHAPVKKLVPERLQTRAQKAEPEIGDRRCAGGDAREAE